MINEKVVLVTGGAGYIGSHACKALKANGYFPVSYDNLISGNEAAVKWGPLEVGDIRDRQALSAVIKKYRPASIMHFAALIQVGDSVKNPAEFYDNNIHGSQCLLEEARQNGITNMVFSSTAAVYGSPLSDAITEAHPLRPINPYGNSKLAMENMIRDYSAAYGSQYAILRYFNAAGADDDGQIGTAYKTDTHLVPLLMQVASDKLPQIQIFGTDYDTHDGTAIRDYIHVMDLAEAHVLALRHMMKNKGNLTLNLGTNNGQSVREVVNTVRRITGHTVPAQEFDRRTGDPAVLVANATEAQRILNWQPLYSDIETIVSTAWAWRRKQNKQGHRGAFAPDTEQRRLAA
ncbi:MAG: galE [Micavibrio sp.]|nr:galE [Micavibrio sp.]